jgi:hypothetical protein
MMVAWGGSCGHSGGFLFNLIDLPILLLLGDRNLLIQGGV